MGIDDFCGKYVCLLAYFLSELPYRAAMQLLSVVPLQRLVYCHSTPSTPAYPEPLQ